jgi:uncharacterized HAD superfamily protein
MKKLKIAVDIDGTVLTQGSPQKDYVDADLIPEMLPIINNLYNQGHEIYFFTARHFKYFVMTKKVLDNFGFLYHGLIMNKPSVDLYIDDKGFRMDRNIEDLNKLIKRLEDES